MGVISMKQLLEAGVHFGHQTRRWNPKMAEYIFAERNGIYIIDLQKSVKKGEDAYQAVFEIAKEGGEVLFVAEYIFAERNGIYIIDLQKTVKKVEDAYQAVFDIAKEGGEVLFVGTKKQAQDSIKEEAERCGMYYVNERWLGGMLTNFETIKTRVQRLKDLEAMIEDGTMDLLPKKEVAKLMHEKEKLDKNIGGIKEMTKIPEVIFIVDPRKERIAVQEAHRLNITTVGIVDTNCDPEEIDHVIPGNDDAIRAVKLIAGRIADAVIEARQGEIMTDATPEETAE